MYFSLVAFALVTPSSSFCERTTVKPDCMVFHQVFATLCRIELFAIIAVLAAELAPTALIAVEFAATAVIAVEDDTTALRAVLLAITAAIAV